MIKRITLSVLALSLMLPSSASAATFTTVQKAIESLKVADESRTGYKRTLFKHWTGVGNSCDSRKAVIIAEAILKPSVLPGCLLKGGDWLSIYDNVRVTDAAKLDVDHMVPLAEAWDSGASAWDALKREKYANDQTDPRHLIAVTGGSNRQKSDRDPSEWMPSNKTYTCEYVANWVTIKVRWSLTVDAKEKAALISNLKGCKTTKISTIALP